MYPHLIEDARARRELSQRVQTQALQVLAAASLASLMAWARRRLLAATAARPFFDLGPVEVPLCIRQRLAKLPSSRSTTRAAQGFPLRHRAPHKSRCALGSTSVFTLLFCVQSLARLLAPSDIFPTSVLKIACILPLLTSKTSSF